MGQNLVVFRISDKNGDSLFCTDESCPHRGASLFYGDITDGIVECAYHGWKFDRYGRCTRRPFEKNTNTSNLKIKNYPICEKYGLVFVWLSDHNPKPLPIYDILEAADRRVIARRHRPLGASWLTMQENAADVTHTVFLHGKMTRRISGQDSTGFSAPMKTFGFVETDLGIVKTWTYDIGDNSNGFGFGNILIFPNVLVIESEVHWRVPLDDNNTMIFIVSIVNDSVLDINKEITFLDEDGNYDMATPFGQDAMALETCENADSEILGQGDYGVLLFRKWFRSKIQNYPIENINNSEYNRQLEYILIETSNYMGGYLPSTGIFRSDVILSYEHKWSRIEQFGHKQFVLEEAV